MKTDHYYKTLGLKKSASLQDIKQAYRKKAKMLHPDLNDSPDAGEQFIQLNEAYEYLQHVKTGKIYNADKKAYTHHKKWKDQDSEKARERARYYAKMRYQEFIESDYYKKIVALDVIGDYLSFSLTIVILTAILFVGYVDFGIKGLLTGAVIIALLSSLWINDLRQSSKNSLTELRSAVSVIIRTTRFQLLFFSMFNIYLVLRIVLNTLIPVSTMLILFGSSFIAGYLLFPLIKSVREIPKSLFVYCLMPGLINLFFVINFLFSTHPSVETYHFTHQYENVGWSNKQSKQQTTQIVLVNNKYDQYAGIRTFFDYKSMMYSDIITYHFAEGCLGFKVLKSYRFSSTDAK